MKHKLLNLLLKIMEAGVGIEPASTALQATEKPVRFSPLRPFYFLNTHIYPQHKRLIIQRFNFREKVIFAGLCVPISSCAIFDAPAEQEPYQRGMFSTAFESRIIDVDREQVAVHFMSDNPDMECIAMGAKVHSGLQILGCHTVVTVGDTGIRTHLIITPFPDDPRYECVLAHELRHAREPNWRHHEREGC